MNLLCKNGPFPAQFPDGGHTADEARSPKPGQAHRWQHSYFRAQSSWPGFTPGCKAVHPQSGTKSGFFSGIYFGPTRTRARAWFPARVYTLSTAEDKVFSTNVTSDQALRGHSGCRKPPSSSQPQGQPNPTSPPSPARSGQNRSWATGLTGFHSSPLVPHIALLLGHEWGSFQSRRLTQADLTFKGKNKEQSNFFLDTSPAARETK